jgi:hypothetical protein
MTTGRHQLGLKRASGLVIRKRCKDDYTQLKAYYSRSLLSWMGKVVERVVAELMTDEADGRGLRNDSEFGRRSGRSAIDTAAMMVDNAHAAWNGGYVAGILLMDNKAAFPSEAKGRLVNPMKVRPMYKDLIQFTESFLSEWIVEMLIEGSAME